MSQNDCKCIHILMELGLTFTQAKIYQALAKLGKADVKTISLASSVSRQEVYREIPKLEQIGLAYKIIASSTMYEAASLDEGFDLLLKKREQEIMNLEARAMQLIKRLNL
jgi:sugar-specific transcriptional regulator TrmB